MSFYGNGGVGPACAEASAGRPYPIREGEHQSIIFYPVNYKIINYFILITNIFINL